MTGEDIRLKTQLIVRKDGAYLSGLSLFIRWRGSPYDAWMTRNIEDARKEIETAQSLARFLDKTAEGVLNEYEGASFERASLMLQTYAAMIMEMEVMDP